MYEKNVLDTRILFNNYYLLYYSKINFVNEHCYNFIVFEMARKNLV